VARPSGFNDEIANTICELIATTPRGLDFICDRRDDLPTATTVHRWLNAYPEFCGNYLRARERQADLIFDQCLEIADNPLKGAETVTKADGSIETREGDMIAHRKLQVDTRMRMAGKLSPKKYGDRSAVEHSGQIGLEALIMESLGEPKGDGA
jgi:hypothetical protein